jgi:hypothetical protein
MFATRKPLFAVHKMDLPVVQEICARINAGEATSGDIGILYSIAMQSILERPRREVYAFSPLELCEQILPASEETQFQGPAEMVEPQPWAEAQVPPSRFPAQTGLPPSLTQTTEPTTAQEEGESLFAAFPTTQQQTGPSLAWSLFPKEEPLSSMMQSVQPSGESLLSPFPGVLSTTTGPLALPETAETTAFSVEEEGESQPLYSETEEGFEAFEAERPEGLFSRRRITEPEFLPWRI